MPNDKVLVTGANGFVALWCIQYLLDAKYSVRGTVRSSSKAAFVADCFPQQVLSGQLEVVVTGELTQQGAFDEAVKGVNAVMHVASPTQPPGADPEEVIHLTLEGTINVLSSVLQYGASVERVIITSTIGTITWGCLSQNEDESGSMDVRLFTEEDTNQKSHAICCAQGKDAPPLDKYLVGKIMADKAAWDFVKSHQDKIKWDLVTLHPSWVFGPELHSVISRETLCTSLKFWYDVVFTEARANYLGNSSGGWVDVRDVANGHLQALQKPEAGGQKFILTGDEPFIWNDFNVIANKLKPKFPVLPFPIAPLRSDIVPRYKNQYSNRKARAVLGISFRSKEETTRDTLEKLTRSVL